MTTFKSLRVLQNEIKACTICAEHLELGPRPVFAVHPKSKIAIIGQAPGTKVHKSGIPWDDKSGENLRRWMDVDKEAFYDTKNMAIVPMGFCYPGKGKTGDLPPRKECAPEWHKPLFDYLPDLELILLIGKYAQDYYLDNKPKRNLTDKVRAYQDYLPTYFVLPHPSPRNNIWMKRNDWFGRDVLPDLKSRVSIILAGS